MAPKAKKQVLKPATKASAKASAKAKGNAKGKAKSKAKSQTKARCPRSGDFSQAAEQTTESKFDLRDFLESAWKIGGYSATNSHAGDVSLATVCTGANTAGSVLRTMVETATKHQKTEAIRVRDLFGSECNKAAQTFLLRSGMAPEHLWEDAFDPVGPESTGAPCIVHNSMCVPDRGLADKLDLLQSGFSCCTNSCQNPSRFSRDIVQEPTPKDDASRVATVQHLVALRPRFAVLENTKGLATGP